MIVTRGLGQPGSPMVSFGLGIVILVNFGLFVERDSMFGELWQ